MKRTYGGLTLREIVWFTVFFTVLIWITMPNVTLLR
jgi:hypothetical protein